MKSIKSIIKEELGRVINQNDRKEELLKYLEDYKKRRDYQGSTPNLKRLDYELINRDLKSFVENLDANMIDNLLNYSSNPDTTAKEIIRVKGTQLHGEHAQVLMQNTSNPDAIGARLIGLAFYAAGTSKKSQMFTYPTVLSIVLQNESDPDKMINLAIKMNKNMFGKEIDPSIIKELLKYSKNKDMTIYNLIDAKGNRLDYKEIRDFLNKTSKENNYEVVNKLINVKGKALDAIDMSTLLDFDYKDTPEDQKIAIAQKLINLKGASLTKYEIERILLEFRYSNAKQNIINLLVKAGVDESDIPS